MTGMDNKGPESSVYEGDIWLKRSWGETFAFWSGFLFLSSLEGTAFGVAMISILLGLGAAFTLDATIYWVSICVLFYVGHSVFRRYRDRLDKQITMPLRYKKQRESLLKSYDIAMFLTPNDIILLLTTLFSSAALLMTVLHGFIPKLASRLGIQFFYSIQSSSFLTIISLIFFISLVNVIYKSYFEKKAEGLFKWQENMERMLTSHSIDNVEELHADIIYRYAKKYIEENIEHLQYNDTYFPRQDQLVNIAEETFIRRSGFFTLDDVDGYEAYILRFLSKLLTDKSKVLSAVENRFLFLAILTQWKVLQRKNRYLPWARPLNRMFLEILDPGTYYQTSLFSLDNDQKDESLTGIFSRTLQEDGLQDEKLKPVQTTLKKLEILWSCLFSVLGDEKTPAYLYVMFFSAFDASVTEEEFKLMDDDKIKEKGKCMYLEDRWGGARASKFFSASHTIPLSEFAPVPS